MSSEIIDLLDKWAAAEKAGDTDALDALTPADARARVPRRKRADQVSENDGPVYERFSRPNGEDYIARHLGDISDVALCRKVRENALPPLFYGPPGTGKTALVEAAYWEGDGGMETVSGSSDTERADFIGSYVQTPDGGFTWVDGPLIRSMERGGVLFIDEIALIDPKVLSVVYSVMDGRNVISITENPDRGKVTAAPGFFVVGACNPDVPGARMSEALVSRFTVQAQYGTDYDLAVELGVPAKFVGAARNLETKRLASEVSWAPQMRECLAFARVKAVFGESTALANLVAVSPEMDRDIIASVLSSTFGTMVEPLAAS